MTTAKISDTNPAAEAALDHLFEAESAGGDTEHVSGQQIVDLAFKNVPTGTPASASATGTAGTLRRDGSYLYICIATDTWRRIAHATW